MHEEEIFVTCVLCGWDIKPSDCMISERGPIHKEHELWAAEAQPDPAFIQEFSDKFFEWSEKHPDWWKP